MKAAAHYHPGGPEVFRYEDVPDPAVPADGVLVGVQAVRVEGGDTLHRARDEVTATPHIVGYQCAGTVLAVGDQVTRFHTGDRVSGASSCSSGASQRVCLFVPNHERGCRQRALSTRE